MKSRSCLQYVQFQPSQDLIDVRFQMMSPAERGVYWTIKLYLYANGGKCPLDEVMLATVTGCENFGAIWEKIKSAFVIKDDTIRHKVVTKDLRRARKCLQGRRKAGLMGAQRRWQSYSGADVNAIAKKSKVKKRKDKNIKEGTLSKFQRPTVGEVSEYAESIGFHGLNSQQFVDFYEAKGWMLGKNKMRNWRAAVRTWKGRSQSVAAGRSHDGKELQYGTSQSPPDGSGRASRKRAYTRKQEPGAGVEVLRV